MSKVVVIVEGETEEIFWKKVLFRRFPNAKGRLTIFAARGRGTLLKQSGRFVANYRALHYRAVIFILDLEDALCVTAILNELPDETRNACQLKTDVHVVVAKRGMETWFLADARAINTVWMNAAYAVPTELETKNPKRILTDLCHRCQPFGSPAYKKKEAAEKLAPHFSPESALAHSKSLERAWMLLSSFLTAL